MVESTPLVDPLPSEPTEPAEPTESTTSQTNKSSVEYPTIAADLLSWDYVGTIASKMKKKKKVKKAPVKDKWDEPVQNFAYEVDRPLYKAGPNWAFKDYKDNLLEKVSN